MSSELKKASVGTAFIGGIFTFLLFGLLVLIWFRMSGKPENFDDKRAAARAIKLNLLDKENHEKLTEYAWVNKAKGIVQLPIDRAMELVVADLKAKPVQASSVKLEVPYPAGLQQPPAAAAPAAAPAVPGAAPATSGTAVPVASPAPVTSGSAVPAPAVAPVAAPTASPASVPSPAASPVPAAATPAATTPAPSSTTTPAP